jgi:predicted alpha/beta-hydrolase family hydrolase
VGSERACDPESNYLGGFHALIIPVASDSLCVTPAPPRLRQAKIDHVIVYLAHGASGNAASMRPYVDGLAKRDVAARAVELPVGKAEKAVPLYRKQVLDMSQAVVGGQSYGGRVASLMAAEESVRGIVLLSYPLHRPGHPDELRIDHWPRITCPVLMLSGESDPFARIDLLRGAMKELADAELVTYPRVGHGLTAVLDDALDRIARFVADLERG